MIAMRCAVVARPPNRDRSGQSSGRFRGRRHPQTKNFDRQLHAPPTPEPTHTTTLWMGSGLSGARMQSKRVCGWRLIVERIEG